MKEYRVQMATGDKDVQVFADRVELDIIIAGSVTFFRGKEQTGYFRFPYIAGYWLADT